MLFIRWLASILLNLVNSGDRTSGTIWDLVLPAYLAGGAVMTLASIFNPISPSLILLSGAGAFFGLNAGLLRVPGIVSGKGSSSLSTQAQYGSAFSGWLWRSLYQRFSLQSWAQAYNLRSENQNPANTVRVCVA